MKTVFLSDAHLTDALDGRGAKILRFLDALLEGQEPAGGKESGPSGGKGRVQRLVIAGDFFDFWFGRGGVIYPGFQPVVEKLSLLAESGCEIILCEGNHDFFLGEHFSGKPGFRVFAEWADIELDGLRVLVSHGDTVDRWNRGYLALRGFLRSDLFFRLQRWLPLAFLWRVSRLASETSKAISGGAQDRLVEVMHLFALEKFSEGYDAVVLGHCHRPLIREEERRGRRKTFATLGDWITHDSFLLCEDGRFSLGRFPAGGEDERKVSL
jgi:UDP-2,3-diacylglucosamine hydrolase